MKRFCSLVLTVVMLLVSVPCVLATGEEEKVTITSPEDGAVYKDSESISICVTAESGTENIGFRLDGEAFTMTGEGNTYSTVKNVGELAAGKHTLEAYSYNADGSINYDITEFNVAPDLYDIYFSSEFSLPADSTMEIGDKVTAENALIISGSSNVLVRDLTTTGKNVYLASGRSGAEGDTAINISFDANIKGQGPYVQGNDNGYKGRAGIIKVSADVRKMTDYDTALILSWVGDKDSYITRGPSATSIYISKFGTLNTEGVLSSKGTAVEAWATTEWFTFTVIFDTVKGEWAAYEDGKLITTGVLESKSLGTIRLRTQFPNDCTEKRNMLIDNFSITQLADTDFETLSYGKEGTAYTVTDSLIPSDASEISVELPGMVPAASGAKLYLNGVETEAEVMVSKSDADLARESLDGTTAKKLAAAQTDYGSKLTVTLPAGIKENDNMKLTIPSGTEFVYGLEIYNNVLTSDSTWEENQTYTLKSNVLTTNVEIPILIGSSEKVYTENIPVTTKDGKAYGLAKIVNQSGNTLPIIMLLASYQSNLMDKAGLVDSSVGAGTSIIGGVLPEAGENVRSFVWNKETLAPYSENK